MRTVIAMSGGVDSSTAAALLVEQGLDVVGVTLKLYNASGTSATLVRRCATHTHRFQSRQSGACIKSRESREACVNNHTDTRNRETRFGHAGGQHNFTRAHRCGRDGRVLRSEWHGAMQLVYGRARVVE